MVYLTEEEIRKVVQTRLVQVERYELPCEGCTFEYCPGGPREKRGYIRVWPDYSYYREGPRMSLDEVRERIVQDFLTYQEQSRRREEKVKKNKAEANAAKDVLAEAGLLDEANVYREKYSYIADPDER